MHETGTLFEPAGCRAVHRKEEHGGEVPDQPVDLGVQGEPVENGEVQGEPRALAPRGESLAKGGRQDAGRGEPAPARQRLEPVPKLLLEASPAARETGARGERARPVLRQLRGSREVRQALAPIRERGPVELALLERQLGEDILAERDGELRELRLRIPVQAGEIAHQEPPAPGVADQEVEADVQPYPAVAQQARPHLEQRPTIARQDLMGHPPADLLQAGRGAGPIPIPSHSAQVEHPDAIERHLREDALRTVRQDDAPQHPVVPDQPHQRAIQPAHVQPESVDLEVDVSRHAAQCHVPAAADPVGLLEVGQRERLRPAVGVRDEPRQEAGRTESGAGADGPHRRPLGDQRRHPRDRRAGKEILQRDLDADRLTQPRDELHGEQRMPAQLEKVVMGAYRRNAEQAFPDLGDLPFLRAARRYVGGFQIGPRMPGRRRGLDRGYGSVLALR